ncbi:leucine--tRNA ligase [Patescibacteria group bacterium]|nr:leucine--tRNA ligase [Patescibacteria group bacterium]
MEYQPNKIEAKWQKYWEQEDLFRAENFSKKPKKYILVEFPYPSGDGLHVGHCRSYTALDIIARKSRMDGYNVMYPMGWDAFGLPTENYAIKTGKHPQEVTKKNTDNFRRQMKSLGFSFDWSREINTTDPEYYKWTQWIFLQLYKKGLAYKEKMPINWCPSCKIGLANEEVVDGKCERCGMEVEKREMEQWMLKITAYADKLIEGLKDVDYPERIKEQQINWIGKSEGAEINFKGVHFDGKSEIEYDIPVFTTRLDTIYGVSALVLAPEHPIISNFKFQISNWKKIEKYIKKASKKSEMEKKDAKKEKTGVPLVGFSAINPFTGEKIPVWIADYCLANYGTGAVMMVPAHDERDFVFAKKYGLDIKEVVAPVEIDKGIKTITEAYTDDGILVNSEEFNGLVSRDARVKMISYAESKKFGRKQINYHLRDWVFSRQHYWGEPIPILYCEKCGEVAVPEKDLPVKLPDVKKYEPTETGESPLANIKNWVNTKCPKCGGKAKRETDTMPNWAGSSWYFLRYTDPKNNKVFADKKLLKYWMTICPASQKECNKGGVDIYNGGMEHTTLHLLYSRFWNQFLYDEGLVPCSEPYGKRTSHGMVLGEGGIKMSKSRGNVINPDNVVEKYGADTLRLYEMFMGPFGDAIPWDTKGVVGVKRFLEKVWLLGEKVNDQAPNPNDQLKRLLHKTIKGVTEDIDNFKFNTAISKMMILVNEISKEKEIPATYYMLLTTILSPFAPHIAEEIWERSSLKLRTPRKSIFEQKWPAYNKELAKDDEIELVVQINGKVRDRIPASADITEEHARELAFASEKISKYIEGQNVKKVIFTGKLVNIVV